MFPQANIGDAAAVTNPRVMWTTFPPTKGQQPRLVPLGTPEFGINSKGTQL